MFPIFTKAIRRKANENQRAMKKNAKEENQILKELNEETEFVKQPYLYAMVGADFTLVQRSIMIEIIHTLQDQFNAYLRGRSRPDGQLTLDLFTEEEKTNRIKTFIIEASAIGVKPDAYEELEQACKNLLRMQMYVPMIDPKSGDLVHRIANLFSSMVIPTKENPNYKYRNEKRRRKSYIQVNMETDTLKQICDLNNGRGYLDHVYRIARISRRKRTPSIYIYLSRWAKDFPCKSVNFIDLKKYLGVVVPTVEKDKNTGRKVEVEKDSYPKFSLFCKFVMDPIKEDLDRLARENKVDFSFDYEPVYKGRARRGDPEEIKFTIHLSGLGEELKRRRKQRNLPTDVWNLLRAELGLTETDIKGLSDMLPDNLASDFRKEVAGIGDKLKKYRPKNERAYAVTVLKNFIMQRIPLAEEAGTDETGEQPKSPDKPLHSAAEMERWNDFQVALCSHVSAIDYNTWLQCMDYVSFDGTNLTVSVPTSFVKDFIEEHYLESVGKAIASVYGDGVGLLYSIGNA